MTDLFHDNLGLARLAAKRYRRGRSFDDAYRSALFGLWLASEAWPASHGGKFSTYAVNTMRRRIAIDRFEDETPGWIPHYARNAVRHAVAGRQAASLSPEKQARAAADALAVLDWRRLDGNASRASRTLAQPDTALDQVADAEGYALALAAMPSLLPDEATVIQAQFPLDGSKPVTQTDTAAALGHSRGWVKARTDSALRQLRRACA